MLEGPARPNRHIFAIWCNTEIRSGVIVAARGEQVCLETRNKLEIFETKDCYDTEAQAVHTLLQKKTADQQAVNNQVAKLLQQLADMKPPAGHAPPDEKAAE